jgi:NAD(P)-dependent dehydrogenase (short-subunit alcohol dehydrogenase family)
MNIIITGSEGLIGKVISKMFEDIGYDVIRCDLSIGHNLNDEDFVKKFFSENKSNYLLNLFGLNNHASDLNSTNNLFDVSLESFTQYLDVNITSLFSVCRQFALNNQKGSIVNVSSLYGKISPDPELYKKFEGDLRQKHIAYGVSKAGVEQLTRHLGVHLAPNIRVNCVAPGGVESENIDEIFVNKFSKKVLIGRQQRVSELFGIFRYLCSEESSYVTCETFRINGGYAQK